MKESTTIKLAAGAVGVLGICMTAVSVWAMVSTVEVIGIIFRGTEFVKDSPIICLAAGVFSIVLAACTFFANWNNQTHISVIAICLLGLLALTVAAMSVAIKDLNPIKGDRGYDVTPFTLRFKAIALVSGASALGQISVLAVFGQLKPRPNWNNKDGVMLL